MDRRRFIEFGIAALSVSLFSLLAGCSKTETAPKLGNQGKLWNLAVTTEKSNEPVEFAYPKNTPAFYRDASLGKADPNFKPKTGGG